jgi:hypothetical protein
VLGVTVAVHVFEEENDAVAVIDHDCVLLCDSVSDLRVCDAVYDRDVVVDNEAWLDCVSVCVADVVLLQDDEPESVSEVDSVNSEVALRDGDAETIRDIESDLVEEMLREADPAVLVTVIVVL